MVPLLDAVIRARTRARPQRDHGARDTAPFPNESRGATHSDCSGCRAPPTVPPRPDLRLPLAVSAQGKTSQNNKPLSIADRAVWLSQAVAPKADIASNAPGASRQSIGLPASNK